MRVYQSSSFAKKVKKLKKKEKEVLDKEVRSIIKNPSVGVEKKGDLRGIFVHKFKIKQSLYLLSYRIFEDSLELIMIGPHENYYRELKSYLKTRKN
jgi:mRNA-degrading endonuclease RelE of RelBE toxin-antitoxin system